MTADPANDPPNIQQELRLSRPFTLADAIGQEAGNFMKGESPIPRLVQAKHGAQQALKESLTDGPGALHRVLEQWLCDDETRLSQHVQNPAEALKDLLEAILRSPETFYELVRQADVAWGQIYDSRPYFQKPGQPPHPDDEYTHKSVRETLQNCLYVLNNPPQLTVEGDELEGRSETE
ncbi:hypothetical protein IQ273_15240 [Nodosilinea sp. LEGE 07298]|uniref:hypothetical protein n=1 Tax=Nodosilinea sp. LEGE 07298 TaxID=2777970 RepID=UPI001881FB5E|nr:hypothetical protein [Nodosilinea sp. LEGE 07298]MBE9110768.1 hypothetical protein [Nodosilinea sp. LEGE 07298]